MRHARLWWVVGGAVLANLVVRGLWVWKYHARPVSDFAMYFGSASRWAESGGFTLDGEHATVAWPPGWPAVLRVLFELTGPSVEAGVALQVVLSSLTAGLVVLVGWKAFGSLRIAVLAAGLFTLLPAGWARDSVLGTEPLFTLLITAGLLALLALPGRRGAVVAGVLWGLATLVRGTLMLAFPLVGVIALARGQGWRRALVHTALAGAAVALVLVPWAVRNYQLTGHFVLVSSNLGQNLWQGTRADVGYWWSNDPRENPVVNATSEVDNDRIGRAAAFEYWQDNPGEWLLRAPAKIAGLYEGNSEAFYWLHRTALMTGDVRDRWNAVADLAYWLVMAFAVVGAVLVARRHRDVAALLVGLPVYTTAVFTFFLTWDRFRAPLMPIFCLLAAYALARVLADGRTNDQVSSEAKARGRVLAPAEPVGS